MAHVLETRITAVEKTHPFSVANVRPKAGVWTPYGNTSLIRNRADLEPYSRAMPRALWWS